MAQRETSWHNKLVSGVNIRAGDKNYNRRTAATR
jgi:hypothetical protein